MYNVQFLFRERKTECVLILGDAAKTRILPSHPLISNCISITSKLIVVPEITW